MLSFVGGILLWLRYGQKRPFVLFLLPMNKYPYSEYVYLKCSV